MCCQVSPLSVIIMIILVGRYCVGFRVTIWNGDSSCRIIVTETTLHRFHINAVQNHNARMEVTN